MDEKFKYFDVVKEKSTGKSFYIVGILKWWDGQHTKYYCMPDGLKREDVKKSGAMLGVFVEGEIER